MPLFRKKPVVITAEQFLPELNTWPIGVEADCTSSTGYGIFTLEHTTRRHEVTPGDWIITGVHGEIYACKNDIFLETYQALNIAEQAEQLQKAQASSCT
mgnify:CR=1 FL=1